MIKKEKAHFVNMAAGLYADYEDKILNEEEYRYMGQQKQQYGQLYVN